MEELKSLRKEKLKLEESGQEYLLFGTRTDGKKYSVRKHRKAYFMPDTWLETLKHLTPKGKFTAEVLIQTGARINESRNIEARDVDYDRNTIRLRVTKTKARKKGEERGSPRTIPINPQFIKRLKKYFKDSEPHTKIKILSTPAFNIALKKALQRANVEDYYMYSAHNIRKTHGNWLKILSNLRMINCDASEICLRLGHDYETFLRDYGSSGVMDSKDILLIKEILGDLYRQ